VDTNHLAAREAISHWSGLPAYARRRAVRLFWAILFINAVLQFFTLRLYGREALAGTDNLVALWDLALAVTVGTSLIFIAGRSESRAFGTIGVLYIIIGIEDQIALHGKLGAAIADLLRFDQWIPGIGEYGAVNIGEFVAMGTFGVVAFLLIWHGQRPADATLRKARMVFTILLVGLFFFAVVIDLVTAAEQNLTILLIEELGERSVLSLSAIYALSLMTITSWVPDR